MNRTPHWRTVLDVVTTVILLAAGVTILWGSLGRAAPAPAGPRPEVPPPSELQPLNGAQIKGRAAASVAVIAYSDFECPFCGRFARETLPEIDRNYIQSGKVAFAFRHSPLERIHARAVKAAEAAECAGRQGRFWEMHDALFADGVALDPPGLLKAAATAGLDLPLTQVCIGADGSAKVRADRAAAEAIGLTGTPAFLIGIVEPGGVRVTKVLRGAQPFQEFAAALDELLARLAG